MNLLLFLGLFFYKVKPLGNAIFENFKPHGNLKLISRYALVLLLVIAPANNFVFAQQTVPLNPQQTIFFTKVVVDNAPVPNKPFKITADIETQNAGDLLVSASAASGLSVVSPIVASPGYTSAQNTVQASWTLVSGQPGTYSVTLLAHANYPPQDVSYVVNVNVGTPNSLVITGLKVPGNIFPNDIFTVSMTVQNEGVTPDSNVMASITVPDGLRLITDANTNSTSIPVNGNQTFSWQLFANSPGSYPITIFYSSTNSGSNSIDSTVNVGQLLIPDVSVSKVQWGEGSNSSGLVVSPGDQFVPMIFTLQNVGNEVLYNVHAYLLLTNPFDVNGSGFVTSLNNMTGTLSSTVSNNEDSITAKDFAIGRFNVGTVQYPTYYVSINKNAEPKIYLSKLVVDFSNGVQNMSKVFEVPITISKTSLLLSSVTVKPTYVYPGDTGNQITIQLSNEGLPVNNIYAILQTPPGISSSWGNSTSANIGRITTMQSIPMNFFVNVGNNMSAAS